MTNDAYLSAAGIVDKVTAIRHQDTDDVVRLEATIRIKTEYQSVYGYSSKKRVDDVVVSLPPTTIVNPGDLAIVEVTFAAPHGQRFQPALEMNEDGKAEDVLDVQGNDEDEDDDDVLEVNVEDGLKEGV